MTEEVLLTQKRAGTICIIFGLLLATAVGLTWESSREAPTGLSSMLPSDDTVLFATFPGHLDQRARDAMSALFHLDWNENIAPWIRDGAFVLLSPLTETDSQKLLPVFLAHVNSKERALEFLLSYRNPERDVQEFDIEGRKGHSTPLLTFAFVEDMVIVSPAAGAVGRILSAQSLKSSLLGNDHTFMQLRRSTPGDYFIYMRPNKLPAAAHAWMASRIKVAPYFMRANSALAIGLTGAQNGWLGSSVAIPEIPIENESLHAYRALLPPYFPSQSKIFISGQDIAGQLKKVIRSTPLIQNFAAEYLPGINIEGDIFPLLSGESGLAVHSDSFLFISESLQLDTEIRLEKIWKALASIAGKWTPTVRTVTLPDGSEAAELVPDQSKIQMEEVDFEGTVIRQLRLGSEKNLHLAHTQQKIFFSNDMALMRRALLLTKAPGENLRDSPTYKTSLQPILKNPELLGVMHVDGMVFSFSKRTLRGRTETNFKLGPMP